MAIWRSATHQSPGQGYGCQPTWWSRTQIWNDKETSYYLQGDDIPTDLCFSSNSNKFLFQGSTAHFHSGLLVEKHASTRIWRMADAGKTQTLASHDAKSTNPYKMFVLDRFFLWLKHLRLGHLFLTRTYDSETQTLNQSDIMSERVSSPRAVPNDNYC